MAFKLAWRNIISKPWRAVATIVAIAIAVAMIFCMLSFKQVVYDFIFATETADAGNSDIIVTYNSSSDRITDVAPLYTVEGIAEISPSLSLFALLNNEYIRMRGFDKDKYSVLHSINVIEGEMEKLKNYPDNIAISKSSAKHFGLSIGSAVELQLGTNTKAFYVAVIAEDDGYFLNSAPFVFVGACGEGVARLIEGSGFAVYNEIYVKAKSGVDLQSLTKSISKLPEYSGMKVELSKDSSYITEQTDGLTAPIVVSGAAVVLLSLACIVFLFMMSERDKVSYLSKLSVVGATRKQILAIFLVESLILAVIGSMLGAALASGVFYALLKITLASTISFNISAVKLIGALGLGVIVSVLASVFPLARAFGGSVRENQLNASKRSVVAKSIPILFVVATIISVSVECSVSGAKGALSIVNLLLAFFTMIALIAYCLRGTARVTEKSSNPVLRIASLNLKREKRFSHSLTMLTVGMSVSMLLFMAYFMTTNIFDSYLSDFKDMVLITNVQSTVDTAEFEKIDGVESSSAMVWRQGALKNNKFDKTVNILGSASTLDIIDFGYITNRELVKERIASKEPYVFLDKALQELYGVRELDTVILTLDGVEKQFVVGGILSHRLFSGNYAVISSDTIYNQFAIKIDTVLAIVSGDASTVAFNIRTEFARKNYYVVEALEAFRWERQSLGSVFDLIGTLAVVISIFIFFATIATVVVGRSTAKRDMSSMISAGMSKKTLLKIEITEHAMTGLLAFVIAFAVSVLLTYCMIGAMRLFGLYFEFMYEAWVVAVVGAVMAIGYTILPIVLNFKKHYNVKKQ